MSEIYRDFINVLETNIDDSTSESLGFVSEILFKNGAKDVFYTPIYMKKNRPAYKLTVLCSDEDVENMENLIFKHTTTIGIRKRREERICLKREFELVETKYGSVKAKTVIVDGEKRFYPEFDSVREIAIKNDVNIDDVYTAVKSVSKSKL